MFGVASAAAYARCGGSGNNALAVLSSLASGFGATTGDGIYVYNIFNAQTGFTTSGFGSSDAYTSLLEDSVGNILGMNGNALIGTAAIIYSYANFPNIEESMVVGYINSFCGVLNYYYGGPFYSVTNSGVSAAIESFSLSGVNGALAQISGSSGDIQKAINYNWYDSSVLFANPNFNSLAQNIKDSENQYYFVSGEFIYPSIPSGLTPCIQFNQNITTNTGTLVLSVITNSPCINPDTYIGPISGIKFFREFNDGPDSSGYFDSATEAAYVSFDEAVLNYNDYHSNNDILYSNERNSSGYFQYLISGGQVDSQGFFSSNNEYGNGRTNILTNDFYCSWGLGDFTNTNQELFIWADYTGTGLPFMSMHQGDNSPKWVLYKYCLGTDGMGHCSAGCGYTGWLNNWTGWKFAPLELKDSLAKNYEFLQMNPEMDTGRVTKRALNINTSPYNNATDTGDGTLTCTGVVGPPQLSNNNPTLPGFAFYQTFDNISFPSYPSIVMRAAMLSGGSYNISNYNLISTGESSVHYPVFSAQTSIPIYNIITSSGISTYDDVTKKCLAIGDNFGGSGVSGSQSLELNAGYSYTGYQYYLSGNLVSLNQLLLEYSNTIGSSYSKINYISGFTGVGGIVYPLVQQYAFIITGDTSTGVNYFGKPILYSYYPDGTLGAVNTGWSIFAPIPSSVIGNPSNYGAIYNTQKVENFIPRYSSGPYLSYENTFLYPNAQAVFQDYSASINGFPTSVNYNIQVNEETVTEVYCLKNQYGQYIYPNAIRATGYSLTGKLKSSMAEPFVPDNHNFDSSYSFSNTGFYLQNGGFQYSAYLGFNMVDSNYVPSINFTSDPSLNSFLYNSNFGTDYITSRWNCGVKAISGTTTKTVMTGINKSGSIYILSPAQKPLFWGYTGKTMSGTMNYTFPIFNLESGELISSLVLDSGINNYTNGAGVSCFEGNQTISLNGDSGALLDGNTFFSGQDPIFYKYIGGRIGSGAESEGGNHPHGIIGDAWYDVNIFQWGTRIAEDCNPCFIGANSDSFYHVRAPENDNYLFVLGLTSSGLNIYSKNLNYYPYYYNYNVQPFTSIISSQGINFNSRWIGTEYYFDFDLSTSFPLFYNTGVLYSSGGLNIGPFDRDVELCVATGNLLFPSGVLLLNNIPITQTGSVGVCPTIAQNFVLDSGIAPGINNRSPVITTFGLIPEGTIANINISGNTGTLMGFSSKSLATIRARKIFASNSFDDPVNGEEHSSQFGDSRYLDFSRFINNNAESQFSVPFQNFDFQSLVGQSFTYETAINSTIFYPQPDIDFYSIVPTGVDAFGNTTYPRNPTAYYWSKKTPNAYFTGIRDVTRISFTINNLLISGIGQIPYQSQQIIVPSGECIVSGIFGYTGQAESAVISDGICLSGISGARSLSGLFQPIYVSDVLSRIPTGIFNIPSGSGYQPVLPAPSYMKSRQNYFYITGGDIYTNASPYFDSGYNSFLWPAWSDLGLLNPELIYEQMPPDDGNVFMGSYLTFSASQGQKISATGFNLSENVTYKAIAQYGFIDSTSTNSIYNTGVCIFSGEGTTNILDSGNLSGILTSEGNSLTMAVNLQNFKV